MQTPNLNIRYLPLALLLLLGGCAEEAQKSAQEYMQSAQAFMDEGDLRSATVEIKNALRNEPKNPDIRWLAGQIYLSTGKSTAAEQEFLKALELGLEKDDSDLPLVRAWIAQGEIQKGLAHFEEKDPATLSAEAQILFAQILLQSGEISRADEMFTAQIDNQDHAGAARIGLARIAITRGDMELAKSYVLTALEHEPDNVFANLIAGELAASEGDFDSAESYFNAASADSRTQLAARLGSVRVQLATDRTTEAEATLTEIIAEQPNVPLAHYLQALIHYKESRTSSARESLEVVLSLAPKHNPTLLLIGKLYLDEGQHELANNALSTLIASDPENAVGRTLLAATQLRLGQPQEALATLGDAVSEQSDDLLVLITAGSALLATEEYSRGSALLEKAATLAEDPTLIRSQLARAHLRSGEVGTAVEEYRNLIKNDGDNPQHHLMLAYSLVQQGKLQQAMDSVNQLKKQGLIALAANLEGAIELARQQPEKARQLFELAAETDPEFVPARLNLARIAITQKRPDDAHPLFNEVLALDPDNEIAILGIAEHALANDDAAKAIDILKEAIKRNNNPRLLTALARLMVAQNDPILGMEYADQAHQAAPRDAGIARMLATLQANQGLTQEALRTLESIPTPRRGNAFELQRAQLLRAVGRVTPARDLLADLLERAPDNITILVNAIALELDEEEIGNAEILLAKFPDVEQKAFMVPTLRGDIHRAAGQHQQALTSYSQAFEKEPSSSLIGSIVGELTALDQRPLATEKLTEWVKNNPEDLSKQLLLANMHMVANNQSAAAAIYEQVLEINPSQPLALNNLTWLYHEQNNPQALTLATRLADSKPERGDILDTAGWVLLANGKKKRALDLLQKAHTNAPDSAEILFHLAVAERDNGNQKEAMQLLTELQSTDPTYAQREEVVKFASEIDSP